MKKTKIELIEDIIKSSNIMDSYLLNPLHNKVIYLLTCEVCPNNNPISRDGVMYYINKDHASYNINNDNIISHFNDLLEIPPIGVSVFYKKLDEEFEEVKVKYVPMIHLQYCDVKIIFNDSKAIIKGYDLSNSIRKKLAYGNIQDNDILYNNGMYCRVKAIKPIDIPEFNKHMITPPS